MSNRPKLRRKAADPEDGMRTFHLYIGKKRIGALVEEAGPRGGTRWRAIYNPQMRRYGARHATDATPTQQKAMDALAEWVAVNIPLTEDAP